MDVLHRLGLDALLVTGATNRRFLSGWSAGDHAPDRPSGVMLVTKSERILFTSPTNLPWAAAEVRETVETRPWELSWQDTLAGAVHAMSACRLGYEDELTPVASHRRLTEVLGPGVELIGVGDLLDAERRIKQPHEVAAIRAALAMTDEAFVRAADHLHQGISERGLASFIDQQFRDLGSEGNAFDTIVAAGPNAARPHHTPSDRPIDVGEPIIIDMGARVDGYCGDLTRTLWVGQPGEQLGTMYRLVADAQRAAFNAITGGAEARAVDQAARDVFAAAGMDKYVVHSVGHAIGLRIHEHPFLSQASTETLAPGNIVTVEPGLYIPEWGGVRIEDVVLVTPDGNENLTSAPKLLGEGIR
jgi:Xaa-Pro aminopeptidase